MALAAGAGVGSAAPADGRSGGNDSASPGRGARSGDARVNPGDTSRPASRSTPGPVAVRRSPATAKATATAAGTRATPGLSAPLNRAPAAAATADAPGLPPGPIAAAVLAAQAYIYGYPLLEFEKYRSGVTSLNTLTSFTTFARPDTVPIWRPNTDTLYSRAVLDLSNGPVVLSIPDMGSRYYSFQLNDPYTNVSGYIGSRSTGSGPGVYAITWSGGPQVAVDGAQVISVPYPSMLLLGRTLAGDPADQQSAMALMNQYTLTATGASGSPPAKTPAPEGLALLDAISAAMELNPPPAADAPALEAFRRIGVGVGTRVADAHLGVLATLAADLTLRAFAALGPMLAMATQYVSAFQHGGWATPDAAIGNYGVDYLLRAGVSNIGPWANTPNEAIYSAGLLDSNLLPLNGLRSYVIHFAPGAEPPAGAFWSVTVYGSQGQLVANSLNRYSISNSRPGELLRRPDGSIDIILSQTDPGDSGANWLPVPPDWFTAYLRVYVPQGDVLDGSWRPPPIKPI